MSTDYSVRLIVGVPLAEIYSEEVYEDTKAKYNEETGAPYLVTVRKLRRTLFGRELPALEFKKGEYLYSREKVSRDWDDTQLSPLEVFFTNYNSEVESDWVLKNGIVGMEVSELGVELPSCAKFGTVGDVAQAARSVEGVLRAKGWQGKYVSVFSQLRVS
jgi:hypothetical protein